MNAEDVLTKALSYLKKCRCEVGSFSGEAERVVELFRRSFGGRPRIKPYHIDPPSPALYSYLEEAKPVVYAEQKFDGTHIQVSSSGLFKHDGNPLANDQLGGLIYVATVEPEKVKKVLDMAEEGYVVELELFGSKYTPMGFHKDYGKPFDLVVFEVGFGDRWTPPPEKYAVMERFGVPHPQALKIDYRDAYQLKEEAEKIAERPDWFEGAVLKAPFKPARDMYIKEYVKTGSLIVFKVKKKLEEKVKEKAEPKMKKEEKRTPMSEVYLELKSEALNEAAKITMEQGEEYVRDMRNTGPIIERIVKGICEAHPELVERFKAEGFTERDIRKVVGEALMDARKKLASQT
ncbi:MAG: hypothetical protein QXW47_10280 [Candidatus Jordarchaeales archaeon]|nr:hypothetical protein [Candidatus Jordarchaeia archaeon]